MKIPEWMNANTVASMRAAERQARARGRDGAGEAWEIARALHPALPTTMILEAVACVLAPDAEKSSERCGSVSRCSAPVPIIGARAD